MGRQQRSARVGWVGADFPSKDAAKRTEGHFVFQCCERDTRQHIKAELPAPAASQSSTAVAARSLNLPPPSTSA